MQNPYIIKVASYKGGVGKTTIAVNLSIALQLAGANVLLIDSDTISPSAGFHLGLEDSNVGYKQLLGGSSNLRQSVSIHAPTGLHVITGAINSSPRKINEERRKKIIKMIMESRYDFIIVDTRPELPDQVIINDNELDLDEVIVVSTPNMPSITAAIKMTASLDSLGIKHHLMLNMVKGRRYEISQREISELYEGKLSTSIPEDEIVPAGLGERIPAYMLDMRRPFSRAIYKNASVYIKNKEIRVTPRSNGRKRMLSWFKGAKKSEDDKPEESE